MAKPRTPPVCIAALELKPDRNSNRDTAEQAARRLADLVAESFASDDVAVSLFDAGGGRWPVAIYFRAAPHRDALRALVTTAVGRTAARALSFTRFQATDWVRDSLAALAPVVAGRFIVHGSHDRARVPLNRIGIEIDAGLAFGTGHHGTTRSCLLALDRLFKSLRPGHRDWRVLDLGTGSGVLAIAAARALRARVLATDIDAAAVAVARANARRNGAGALLEVVRADGVAAASVRRRAPFDLVLANILLGPLQRMAAPFKRLTAPGGRVVVSGLLSTQAAAAMAAYRPLVVERRFDLDGWTTLVLARRIRPTAT